MKLGEMLLRDGRLTEPQLEAALRFQARDGGRLGTVLVENGFIDLEALTVYLGLELGIPIATGAMLARAKRAAVRLLQPPQAFRHKCVPLVVQDRQLIAAIEDPHDFANLDGLAQITGYRVLPRVASHKAAVNKNDEAPRAAVAARTLRLLSANRCGLCRGRPN
jgi:hypothetical protein